MEGNEDDKQYLKRIRGYRQSHGPMDVIDVTHDPTMQYKKMLTQARNKETKLMAEISELKNYKRKMSRNEQKFKTLEEDKKKVEI